MATKPTEQPQDEPQTDQPAEQPQDEPQPDQPVTYIVNGQRVDPSGQPVKGQ